MNDPQNPNSPECVYERPLFPEGVHAIIPTEGELDQRTLGKACGQHIHVGLGGPNPSDCAAQGEHAVSMTYRLTRQWNPIRGNRLVIKLFALSAMGVAMTATGQSRTIESLAEAIEARVVAEPEAKLWPLFAPAKVPLAIFDGERTWVFRHPKVLAGYAAGPKDSQTRAGRDPSIIANSNAEIQGVGTATLLLGNTKETRSAGELTAVAIHEAFHVFQRKHHPKWVGNEGDLFTYPVDDAKLLALRREETFALRSALATPSAKQRSCWSRAALAARAERYTRLSAEHAVYERGTELNEGLATYVQGVASGKRATLSENEYPAAQVRQRAYATGAAIAALLDLSAPGWKASLDDNDTQQLDGMLRSAMGEGEICQVSATDRRRFAANASTEVSELARERAKRLTDFVQSPGWRVIVVADTAPLWPQGFDPLNVEQVALGRLLHSRFVKLGNEQGELEVLGKLSLSDGAGKHPLFEGVKRLEVVGLEKPKIANEGARTRLEAEGFRLSMTGVQISEHAHIITVRLAAKPALQEG